MIKAVFFDFDGVLTQTVTGAYQISSFISIKTGIGQQRVLDAFRLFLPLDVSTGHIADYWKKFCQELDANINIDLLQEAYQALPRNERMFDIVKSVRETSMTGIITDNIKERFNFYKEYWHLDEYFDSMICSAEIGCTKQDTRIFEIALDSLDVKPEESIFIDNSEKNCEMAEKTGMKAIFHDDSRNDIGKLKSKLVNLFKTFK